MKSFQEEYPELVKNVHKVLVRFQKGKMDIKDAEIYFYSVIDMEAMKRVAKADHEAAYRAAEQMLNASIEMYDSLEERNIGRLFQQFLVEKFSKEAQNDQR
jgi:hypothetical protein